MKIEIRCENCRWHLADIEHSDSEPQNFSFKKICPHCKTRNVIKIINHKILIDTSAPAG